jgi:hypothetical protein
MENTENKIYIADCISPRLGFRSSAEEFFNSLETVHSPDLIIDFSGTKLISRSFAHEYLCQKKRINKHITEENVPANISKMFFIVDNSKSKHKIERNIQKTVLLN